MVFKKNIKLLIFDFDGTLFDLKIDWARAKKELQVEEGESMGQAIDRHKSTGNHGPLNKLTTIEHSAIEVGQLSEDVKSALIILQNKYKIAIFSRNSGSAIRELIGNSGLKVDYIVGRDEVKKLKPDPEGIYLILNRFSISPEEAIIIGDTSHDQLVASASGTNCIIVGDNYAHTEPPEHHVNNFSELLALLI